MSSIHYLPNSSRVPPPGDASAQAAQQHYENSDPLVLTNAEKVAIHHLRGNAHFGPMCPICVGGAS